MKAHKIFLIFSAVIVAIMGIIAGGIGIENNSSAAVGFGIMCLTIALFLVCSPEVQNG